MDEWLGAVFLKYLKLWKVNQPHGFISKWTCKPVNETCRYSHCKKVVNSDKLFTSLMYMYCF